MSLGDQEVLLDDRTTRTKVIMENGRKVLVCHLE